MGRRFRGTTQIEAGYRLPLNPLTRDTSPVIAAKAPERLFRNRRQRRSFSQYGETAARTVLSACVLRQVRTADSFHQHLFLSFLV